MRIDDIIQYWNGTRDAGHSIMQLLGVREETEFIYVVLDASIRNNAKRTYRKALILTVQDDYRMLYGKDLPLIIDHAALEYLVKDEQERLRMIGREMRQR